MKMEVYRDIDLKVGEYQYKEYKYLGENIVIKMEEITQLGKISVMVERAMKMINETKKH